MAAVLSIIALMAGWFIQLLPGRIAPRSALFRWLMWIIAAVVGVYLFVVAGAVLGLLLTGDATAGLSPGGGAASIFLISMIGAGIYSRLRGPKAKPSALTLFFSIILPTGLLIVLLGLIAFYGFDWLIQAKIKG